MHGKRFFLPPTELSKRRTQITRAPREELELTRVLSFSSGESPSLFINISGDVVFHSASLCVVQDAGAGGKAMPQRFYRGHTGLITCMAMCESDASPKGDRLRLIASGQAWNSRGGGGQPCVCLWDSVTLEERARLTKFAGGVVSLSFSPTGER